MIFLINVFNKIHETMPESKLLLIGGCLNDKTYLNEIKIKIKTLKLEKDVKPFRFKGLPLVGIEA